MDVAKLARDYFVALDGHANCDVSAEDLRAAELRLRHAVWEVTPTVPERLPRPSVPISSIEDQLRRMGQDFEHNSQWKTQVWSKLQLQEARATRWRRFWAWMWPW